MAGAGRAAGSVLGGRGVAVAAANAKRGAEGAAAVGAGVARAQVQRLLEDLAGLERQHAPLADLDRLPGLRVAPGPLPLVAQHEVAEAADLDLLTLAERLLHHLEDEIDELGRLLAREATHLAVQRLDDLGLRHD